MNGQTYSIRIRSIINMMPIILLSLYYFTHFIEESYSFFVPLVLIMFWTFHSLAISNISDIFFNKGAKWWMVYAIVSFLMVILGFSSTNINFFITRIPYYTVPAIGYFVIKHYNTREMIILLSAISIIFFANMFQNIFLWTLNPEIFEEQASTDLSLEYSRVMNLTSTSFVAVCLFSIGMLVMLIDNIKGLIPRLLVLSILLIIAFFILFINSRGTATLLLGVMIVGLFFAKFEPKRTNVKSYYIANILIIVFVGSFIVIPILLWLLENMESKRLAERLEDVMSFMSSKGNVNSVSDTGSMGARIALSQTSLNTFFSNPINMLIGIGDHTVEIGMDLHKTGIGNHSEFFDVLARYGLVGAFVFIKILKSYYQNLKSIAICRSVMKYVNVVFFIFVLYGFLNNCFIPIIHIFMFIIFPIVIMLINQKYIIYGR